MNELDLSQFHFIRPWVWWFAVPVIFLIFLLRKYYGQRHDWSNIIESHLLTVLLAGKDTQKPYKGLLLSLACFWFLIITAIAGPSWKQVPLPVFEAQQARVILLDLSLSMESIDIKPSRLARAKHKLQDILKASTEGQVALVVYAGDAFTISPLTNDADTISNMIPALSSSIMPLLGSRADLGIQKAIQLLQNAKLNQGEIIWITDGVEQNIDTINHLIQQSNFEISILAVGTESGAPIPLPRSQGFLKDKSGAIVLPTLDLEPLKKIAHSNGGIVHSLTADDSDLSALMSEKAKPEEFTVDENQKNYNEQWQEMGYWLIFLLLPITLLAFRRGVILSPLLLFFTLNAVLLPDAYAKTDLWDDLWLNKDQQGVRALQQESPEKAAELFQSKDWKGSAYYRSGNYQAAANQFRQLDDATANYNLGNTLALQEKYKEAIEAYQKALNKQPDFSDASHNKGIVEKLLEQQEQQQKNQQQKNQQQQNQEQQDNQEQNQNQQGQQENQDSQQENAENQPQNQEEQPQEQQQAQQQPSDDKTKELQEEQLSELEQTEKNAEQDQALEQWLRKIPDDPGGLLRRKMYLEYQRRGKRKQNEKIW